MKFVYVFHELFYRIECIALPSVFKSNHYVSEYLSKDLLGLFSFRFSWGFGFS